MNETVWITLIVAAAVVVIVALWLGRHLRANRDADGSISLEVGDKTENTPLETTVKVAEDLAASDIEASDIAGIKASANSPSQPGAQNIEVAKGAKIERSKLDDIVGIKIDSNNNKD